MAVNNLFYKKKKFSALYVIILLAAVMAIFISFNGNLFKKKVVKMEKSKVIETNLPRWNLNDLYMGMNDPKISEDMEDLEKRIKKFSKNYSGRIAFLGGFELYRALREYENISELATKLMSYAYLNYAQDLSKPENVSFYQNTNEKITKLLSNTLFVDVEINAMTDTEIREKINSSGKLMNNYSEYIKVVRLFKNHQLSLELEKYTLEKSVTSREAWSRLFDETMTGLKFKFKGKSLNESEILDIMYNDKNENVRKEASKIFGETLGENIKIFSFITNILAKDKEISDEWRKYKTPISSRNLSNRIEDDVVENLYEVVQENYENISHNYYRLKAKMLNKNKLHYSDRNAPLPFNDDKIYTWKEAVETVLNAYRDFSPKMAEIGQLFFDNGWIDVPAQDGKRSGAFAHPTVPTVHPYILLNFQGTRRDVLTLAHELGHGIHMYLAKDQGYFMSDTPLTLAETASIFGEQLTFRYMLKNEGSREKKIALLTSTIEDKLNTVVRQIAFLEFEKRVHEERKNGEIPTDKINEIWLDSQKKSLGDAFEFDDEYKYYWSYVPHFIHSPFYVYSYAFGDCLVNTLYSLYMEEPKGFNDKYIELLSAGGSRDYKQLLKKFKLNPKNREFWQNGLNLVTDLIKDLEILLKEN